MSERLASGPFEFDQKMINDTRKIGERALAIVTDHYGSGYPYFEGGTIQKLLYHGTNHSEHTGEIAAYVGGYYGVNETGQELLQMYGRAHDIVQLQGIGENERQSAQWLEEQMLAGGLPPLAAKFGRAAILGTEPIFDNWTLIDQMVNHMEFESLQEELFAKSVATADLSELYTPFGALAPHLLYAEREGVSDPSQELPMDGGLIEFQEKQLITLDRYRYPLPEVGNELATHKSQVLNYHSFIYEKLQAGQLESWQNLLRLDEMFLRNPDMPLR